MSSREKILNQIISLSCRSHLHDKTDCKIITIKNIDRLAKKTKISPLTLEIISLENKIIPSRYIRNMKTFSFSDQLKLLNTHVGIVGLGGLGGTVLENLARTGIGHFTLIDGDVFEEHNLNRQLLSTKYRIGKSKTDIAKQHLANINPSASVIALPKYLTEKNSYHLLDGCEIAIDCLDNIGARFTLETASKIKKIPMVSASVGGISGHVTTIFPNDKGLELIFGKNSNGSKNKGAETTLGCIAHAVSTVASIECNEVINIILAKKTLKNNLLVIDMEDYTFEILRLN